MIGIVVVSSEWRGSTCLGGSSIGGLWLSQQKCGRGGTGGQQAKSSTSTDFLVGVGVGGQSTRCRHSDGGKENGREFHFYWLILDGCTVAAGVYITAASKVSLYNKNRQPINLAGELVAEGANVVKGMELNGKSYMLYYNDSQTGKLTARPNTKVIELNESLHA